MSFSNAKLARILIICEKRGMKDDILSISPDTDSTGYNVRFTQNTIRNETTSYMSNNELAPYLYRFFRSVQNDLVPYDALQVDCPTFPSVIISNVNLLNYYPVLVDQIQSIQLNWPSETNGEYSTQENRLSQTFSGKGRIVLVLQKDGCEDSILTVWPAKKNQGYYVRLDQQELHYITEGFVNKVDLMLYMERFFRSLISDEESCENVQFDCPLYPTTIVPTQNLSLYYGLFMEQIYALQLNWPMEKSNMKNTESSHDWSNLA